MRFSNKFYNCFYIIEEIPSGYGETEPICSDDL
jgi:hypothetical protein